MQPGEPSPAGFWAGNGARSLSPRFFCPALAAAGLGAAWERALLAGGEGGREGAPGVQLLGRMIPSVPDAAGSTFPTASQRSVGNGCGGSDKSLPFAQAAALVRPAPQNPLCFTGFLIMADWVCYGMNFLFNRHKTNGYKT